MIAASVLGLPAILLLLTVLPCIRMGHEPGVAKYRRAQLAGVLLILLGKISLWLPNSSEGKGAQVLQLLLQEKCEKKSREYTGQQTPTICVGHIPEEFRQDSGYICEKGREVNKENQKKRVCVVTL